MSWTKKITCSICGVEFKKHPEPFCKRTGISPQLLNEKLLQEKAIETRKNRLPRLRELYRELKRKNKGMSTKSCSGRKLPKKGRNTLTKTPRKRQLPNYARIRAQPAKTAKRAVYNYRRVF